jgi:hypothetical protein
MTECPKENSLVGSVHRMWPASAMSVRARTQVEIQATAESRTTNLLPSRFLSLKAFGRRPRCKPHRRHGPASETLNIFGCVGGVGIPANFRFVTIRAITIIGNLGDELLGWQRVGFVMVRR